MTAADAAAPRVAPGSPRLAPEAAKERSLASDDVHTSSAAAALALTEPLLTGRLLVASDFDGTLAGLRADPWAARIIPRAQRALRRLAATRDVEVVLISGRTILDLAARARIGGIDYHGDHGAEHSRAPRGFRVDALSIEREPSSTAERGLVAALVEGVPRLVREPWLKVEDKVGSVTFHVREAPDIDAARDAVVAAVDHIDPDRTLRRSGSRRAVELRPRGASDKGTTLRRLIGELEPAGVIMLGDDRNDALAFDALRTARRRGAVEGLAIAVAGHPDVTADVAPRADLTLAGPVEVSHYLAGLVQLLQAAPPHGRAVRSQRQA